MGRCAANVSVAGCEVWFVKLLQLNGQVAGHRVREARWHLDRSPSCMRDPVDYLVILIVVVIVSIEEESKR